MAPYACRGGAGSGEREDVVAVCRYLQSECGVEAVYVVGYSYGSAIGCSVVNDVDIIKVRIRRCIPRSLLWLISSLLQCTGLHSSFLSLWGVDLDIVGPSA